MGLPNDIASTAPSRIVAIHAAALALLATARLFAACSPDENSTVELLALVGAAAGPPVEECADTFAAQTGTRVLLEQGSSGALLSRIVLTGKGDVYVPGSPDYLERAREKALVDVASVRRLAYLIPSVVVPHGNPLSIQSLEDLGQEGARVGIGEPFSVCVGAYGVEILETAEVADRVRPNVVTHAQSCASTAGLVALGSVDAAMGWRVFAAWNPDRIEVVPIAPHRIPRLGEIPATVLASTEHPDEAAQFVDHLAGPRCREVFAQHGYIVSEEAARAHAPEAHIGGTYDPPEAWR